MVHSGADLQVLSESKSGGNPLGYRLAFDNIDFGVKARYMRADKHRNQSLHCVNIMAVQNRIDHSEYPDVHPATCLDHPKRRATVLLPSKQDDAALRSNIAVLVSRVLADHMPFFQLTFRDVVEWHIKHRYYSAMSSKSVVVTLLSCGPRGKDYILL